MTSFARSPPDPLCVYTSIIKNSYEQNVLCLAEPLFVDFSVTFMSSHRLKQKHPCILLSITWCRKLRLTSQSSYNVEWMKRFEDTHSMLWREFSPFIYCEIFITPFYILLNVAVQQRENLMWFSTFNLEQQWDIVCTRDNFISKLSFGMKSQICFMLSFCFYVRIASSKIRLFTLESIILSI